MVFASAVNPMISARVGIWKSAKGRLATMAVIALLGPACLVGSVYSLTQAPELRGY